MKAQTAGIEIRAHWARTFYRQVAVL